MKIVVIGDIVGKSGRDLVKRVLPELRERYQLDAVIANGENAAGGAGLTPKIADQLFAAGIDIITSGNHIWKKKEIIDYLDKKKELIRPMNLSSPEAPGAGTCEYTCRNGRLIAVINLVGRVFMDAYSCPFQAADEEIMRLADSGAVILVDFHAEATAEKQALGWYLDGRVAAVLGTHTHVQTADERVLPQGTAYITDVGMTGAMDSVLGVKKELAIQKFLTAMPVRFEPSTLNPRLHAVVLTIDPQRGIAQDIQRMSCQMPL
ncbi:TIGR00282 family metallophosphoesterase [candidate division KSB3 bacterium]|uniref:TIGR00282 family metallophosphoesterase n=1 Tax=candidate division KSB3 bacterium TaxID=2044937 RepID=A0A2G6EAQ4_9BACT|nr:MAG: TIGR00282 family metallophosphoesterase [candidate division KSB3 bacterium]PIE30835.1 MAG: TIGR00282 family metallophosphoesterase [candidate division KSB3 bacterium]